MQNIYPLFERNRILKKELLWSLWDYVMRKGKIGTEKPSNKDIFRGLCNIVKEAGGYRADKGRKKNERKMILVD